MTLYLPVTICFLGRFWSSGPNKDVIYREIKPIQIPMIWAFREFEVDVSAKKMLVWRSINTTVPNNVQFSLGNFIKHLPSSTISCPYRLSIKTLVTTSALSSSSYFETLTSRQKDQLNLYVHTLLEWNQVSLS